MIVMTWNIQWCRGVDGKVDPARIVDTAQALADFDVLCLQEVADNFPGLAGSAGENQFAELAALLPGYAAFEGVGVDRAGPDGKRQRFGNLLLSRLPVIAAYRHLLPWPADPVKPGMQRIAIEAVIDAPGGPLRVLTTHLEYYSKTGRAAQVERLRELHADACGHTNDPVAWHDKAGPFGVTPRPWSAVLTGDFNYRHDAPEHPRMQAPIADGVPRWVDAWGVRHPGRAPDPTVGVHDHAQWPAPFTCDFIYVTEDLAPRVVDLRVDLATAASDHQPVALELRSPGRADR